MNETNSFSPHIFYRYHNSIALVESLDQDNRAVRIWRHGSADLKSEDYAEIVKMYQTNSHVFFFLFFFLTGSVFSCDFMLLTFIAFPLCCLGAVSATITAQWLTAVPGLETLLGAQHYGEAAIDIRCVIFYWQVGDGCD